MDEAISFGGGEQQNRGSKAVITRSRQYSLWNKIKLIILNYQPIIPWSFFPTENGSEMLFLK